MAQENFNKEVKLPQTTTSSNEAEVKVISTSTLLGREINVYGTAEHPFFLAKDVADWLGLSNVSDMVSRIETEEVAKFNLGGLQGVCNFLSEDGLYEALMQSRKKVAKQFKKGVKTILKEIRKTGSYSVMPPAPALPQNYLEALKALVAVEEEKIQLQLANQSMKPKAEYFDNLVERNLLTNFRDTAKQLHIPQNTLIELLITNKYIYRDKKGTLKPYSEYTPEYFEMKDYSYNGHAGVQTLVTPKGKEAFRLMWGGGQYAV